MCRRNNRQKSKVFAQFEAAKAGGVNEKEGEVAEKVKKFVAKSDGLKKCVMIYCMLHCSQMPFVCRGHAEKREGARGQQQLRCLRDAEKRYNHRISEEDEWQKQGVAAYNVSPCPCKWPPISGEPASFSQLNEVEKARKVDEYFEYLSNLPSRVHTCPACLQRSHSHGAPSHGNHECRNCVEYPSGWQVDLAQELDMEPIRETDPQRRAAKEEWAALLQKHGPLLPTEESLLSPVLCFVKVGLQHCHNCWVTPWWGGGWWACRL